MRGDEASRRSGRVMRVVRRLAIFTFVSLVLMFVTSQAGETEAEVKLKTGFLFKFLHYVEWPDTGTAGQEIDIAVIGGSRFYDALKKLGAELGSAEKVHVDMKTPRDKLVDYDVVVIASSKRSEIETVLAGLNGSATLTIGDAEGLAEAGVMINFVSVATDRGKKVRFEINSGSARNAHLKISSQLLQLAVKVIGQEEE